MGEGRKDRSGGFFFIAWRRTSTQKAGVLEKLLSLSRVSVCKAANGAKATET